MSNLIPTPYEKLTHIGRCVCEKEELGMGYCGSCSMEIHVKQMRDPSSWVHSSKDRWENRALEQRKIGCLSVKKCEASKEYISDPLMEAYGNLINEITKSDLPETKKLGYVTLLNDMMKGVRKHIKKEDKKNEISQR